MNAKQIIEQLKQEELQYKYDPKEPYWSNELVPEHHICIGTVDARDELGTDEDYHIYDVYADTDRDYELYAVTCDDDYLEFWHCDGAEQLRRRFPLSQYKHRGEK